MNTGLRPTLSDTCPIIILNITSPNEKTEKSPVTCTGVNPNLVVNIGSKTFIAANGNEIKNTGNDILAKILFSAIKKYSP